MTLLRLLLVATLPQAVVSLYLSVERVRANVGRVLAVEAAVVVLVTAGAIVGMDRLGLIGVGWAWLVAQSIVAALVAPALWRACREPAAGPATWPGRRDSAVVAAVLIGSVHGRRDLFWPACGRRPAAEPVRRPSTRSTSGRSW